MVTFYFLGTNPVLARQISPYFKLTKFIIPYKIVLVSHLKIPPDMLKFHSRYGILTPLKLSVTEDG